VRFIIASLAINNLVPGRPGDLTRGYWPARELPTQPTRADDVSAAVVSWRRALYLEPRLGLAAFQLGRAHEALGDRGASPRLPAGPPHIRAE
jgi:hypothetical protein